MKALAGLSLALAVVALPIDTFGLELDPGGSLRLRYEDKRQFDLDDGRQDYLLSQLRLNMQVGVTDWFSGFVEVQDARVFGEDNDGFPPINDRADNQVLSDQLDIHQLYADLKIGQIVVRAGRQKMNLGDQRLVASLEWVNTARVHDGVRLEIGSKRKVNLFATRLVGVDVDDFNDHSIDSRYLDAKFHGLHVTDDVTIKGSQLEYFWFVRSNSDFGDEVYTLGGRWQSKIQEWQWEAQAAMQWGDFGNQDHSAYMYRVSVNRDLLGGNVAFGYNFASGDGDPNDNEHETFDNLYPLNHAYYGYMDFFSLQNLVNAEVVYQADVAPLGGLLRIAYQHFWLADESDAWYNAGLRSNRTASGRAESEVGGEIDLTLKVELGDYNTTLVGGYSHFFAGDFAAKTGAHADADFFFLMAKVTF